MVYLVFQYMSQRGVQTEVQRRKCWGTRKHAVLRMATPRDILTNFLACLLRTYAGC